MSSATMHYLEDSLIVRAVAGLLTVSQADGSRGPLDIRPPRRHPAARFPPHQRTSQYRSTSTGRWGDGESVLLIFNYLLLVTAVSFF